MAFVGGGFVLIWFVVVFEWLACECGWLWCLWLVLSCGWCFVGDGTGGLVCLLSWLWLVVVACAFSGLESPGYSFEDVVVSGDCLGVIYVGWLLVVLDLRWCGLGCFVG